MSYLNSTAYPLTNRLVGFPLFVFVTVFFFVTDEVILTNLLQMQLFTHIRLAHCFSNRRLRLLCVQARLQALSVLVYSNALAENAHALLYSGILEELVELLEMPSPNLVEIRAAALRTLTSIIHLDRNPHFPKWVIYVFIVWWLFSIFLLYCQIDLQQDLTR